MDNLYTGLEYQQASQIESLSKLMYELREHRKALLAQYHVADELAMLEQIYTGKLGEHPAYEHYLSARILWEMQETTRMTIADHLREANKS